MSTESMWGLLVMIMIWIGNPLAGLLITIVIIAIIVYNHTGDDYIPPKDPPFQYGPSTGLQRPSRAEPTPEEIQDLVKDLDKLLTPKIFGIPEQEWLTKKKLYMSSELWNIKRKRVLKRDNYTCQKCQAKYVPLDVHHISYKHVGDEPLKTLTSVCRTCHSNLHQELGYDYEREYPLT